MESATSIQEDTAKTGSTRSAAQRPPIYDGWEIDEHLRHVRRVLGPLATPRRESGKTANGPKFRLDAGHDAPAPHRKRTQGPRKKKKQVAAAEKRAPGDRSLAVLAWLTLSLGAAGFACGITLMAWSMNTARPELWTIGTPIVFAGQIALVMGLILQLDRAWRDSRWAATKMETVDSQLHDQKTATTLLSTTHGPSSAFYAHWAGGAGPEILLSDLRSQLDLLAVKLAQQ